jgi:hypothetical protein
MPRPKRIKKKEFYGRSSRDLLRYEEEGYGDKVMGKDSRKWDISLSLIQI